MPRIIIRVMFMILKIMGVTVVGGLTRFEKASDLLRYFRLGSMVDDIEGILCIIKQKYQDEFYACIPTDRGVPDRFLWKKHIYYHAMRVELMMNGKACVGGIHCSSYDELDMAFITCATDFEFRMTGGRFRIVNGELVPQ